MRTSPFDKRSFRIGLLALVAAVSYWICSAKVETAPRLVDERPPMYVLQVGIGKYVNAPVWAELRGAVTDVVEMRKVLESERWSVPPGNIVTLTDAEGTKPRIFEKFRSHLIENAKKYHERVKDPRKGAVVMFQFSGHGSQVPDVDHDERDDGKDETLVTHDSQDVNGKNFDITDDEIYALTNELRQWTHNIVYVLDSCHSGSGTRDAEDVRRLPERKTVPEPVGGVGITTRSETKKGEDGDSGVLPADADYIVITAARPNELASQKNCFEECGATTRPVVFGNLTFYLIDELRNARADTSYRELMENVRRRVTSEKPTQTPQLEGDGSRFVFSGLGSKEDNFVRISGAETKRPNGDRYVKIRAGAMQGVTVDTIVNFYDKSVSRFDQAEKIATGIVRSVTAGESSVLINDGRREIKLEDRATIVSPDLGALRLKVNLDADSAKLSAAEKNVISTLREGLTPRSAGEDHEIALASIPAIKLGRWDVAVLRDKYSAVARKIGGEAVPCEVPGATSADPVAGKDEDVFYIAGKDYVPMFRYCMFARVASEREQMAAATRIENVLAHLARLRAISSISNPRSQLSGKVTITPVKLEGPYMCEAGRFKATSQQLLQADASSGVFTIGPREVFWFELTNNSRSDLYLAFINIRPDGSVKLFSPHAQYDGENAMVPKNGGTRILLSDACRIDADGNISNAAALRASAIPGLERFKLIVSTEPIARMEFAYLEMRPLMTDRKQVPSIAGKKDWTTIETDLLVSITGK